MKKSEKIKIVDDYCGSLRKSWTYQRMTEEEKQRFEQITEWIKTCGALDCLNSGNSIMFCCLSAYYSYLKGIGYTGGNWRE